MFYLAKSWFDHVLPIEKPWCVVVPKQANTALSLSVSLFSQQRPLKMQRKPRPKTPRKQDAPRKKQQTIKTSFPNKCNWKFKELKQKNNPKTVQQYTQYTKILKKQNTLATPCYPQFFFEKKIKGLKSLLRAWLLQPPAVCTRLKALRLVSESPHGNVYCVLVRLLRGYGMMCYFLL